MAYPSRSYRDAQGYPRDHLEDTATDLRRIVDEDSGRHERIDEIIAKQTQLTSAVVKSHADLKTRVAVLESRLSGITWGIRLVIGILLVALVDHLWKK